MYTQYIHVHINQCVYMCIYAHMKGRIIINTPKHIHIYIYARYPKGQLAQLEANLGLRRANLRLAEKAIVNARSNKVRKLPLR